MTPLSDEDRIRFFFFFLVRAAEAKHIIIPDSAFEVFGASKEYLDRISNICKQYDLPNLVGVVAGQNVPHPSFSNENIQKFRLGVREFPAITGDEAPVFNFYTARYCGTVYAPDNQQGRIVSAFDFWADIDIERIRGRILNDLNEVLFNIVKVVFVQDDQRQKNKGQADRYLTEFQNYSAQHAFLVIYQRDYSETLGSLHDLEAHYQEEKSNIESTKGRVDDLFKNTNTEIIKQFKRTTEERKIQADEIVEEAKKRYSENLLSGYVEQFYKDADDYQATAFRWFICLAISFVVTLLTAVGFLGKFTFASSAASPNLIDDLVTAALSISGWTLGAAILLLLTIYISKNSIKFFSKAGLSTPEVNSFLQNLKFSLNTALIGLPVLLFLYILTHYFQLEITSPSITAQSFQISKDQSINWAALLSGAAPRIIILLLAAGVTAFCAKMYKIQKHLEAANRYRATALSSFRVFVDTMDDTEDSKYRKEKLFDELASLIYTPIQTGFQDEQKLKTSELAGLVASATKKIAS